MLETVQGSIGRKKPQAAADKPIDTHLDGDGDSLEQMSAEGYSDYYAEDLSRRVNAQTRGIFDPEGEHSDVAEDKPIKPVIGDSEQ